MNVTASGEMVVTRIPSTMPPTKTVLPLMIA